MLHERDSRQVERVACGSVSAAAAGIAPGMPLGEALALYHQEAGNASQSLVALPADPAADLQALQHLAQRCEIFSPLVGWESLDLATKRTAGPPPALDYLLLDVTGIGPLFGGEAALASQVAALCAAHGYEARIAIAETMGAAWALTTDDSAATSAPCLIPSGKLEEALAALPIAALRLEKETTRLLLQLGVRQVAELLRLSRGGLADRFGQQVLMRLDRVLGRAADTLIPLRPPVSFSAAWRLEYPTEQAEVLAHLLQRLLERISAALQCQQQGAMRLICRLEIAGSQPLLWQVGLYRPAACAEYLWSLLRVPFEQMQLRGEVNCIQIEAALTAPLEQHQQQLFADSTRTANRDLAVLLDRLGSRLGMDAVLHAKATDDSLPEREFAWISMVGETRGWATTAERPRRCNRALEPRAMDQERFLAAAGLRPLTFLAEPQAIQSLTIVSGDRPGHFMWRGKPQRIVRYWGPQRIETGWQRGRTVRRDYYRVEIDSGEWYWIFRTLPRGLWFMHGVFD